MSFKNITKKKENYNLEISQFKLTLTIQYKRQMFVLQYVHCEDHPILSFCIKFLYNYLF